MPDSPQHAPATLTSETFVLRHATGGLVAHYRHRFLLAATFWSVTLLLMPMLAFNETARAPLSSDATADVADPVESESINPEATTTPAQTPPPVLHEPGPAFEQGMASYYSDDLSGNPTASGEPYDPAAFTAAHRTLPLGTKVRVTNLRNGRSVIVRINDRGPFHGKRVIDLSRTAAYSLGLLRRGTARVRLEVVR